MGSLGAVLKHPEDFHPLLKPKMATRNAEKRISQWSLEATLKHPLLKLKMAARNARKQIPLRSWGEILKHPDDFYPLLKVKIAVRNAEMQIPQQPHWEFSYSMLHKVSKSLAFVIQQLGTELRDEVCVFYLVLRALDTIEDDISVPADCQSAYPKSFSTALVWWYKGVQGSNGPISSCFHGFPGAREKVETVDDYDEYCHYVAGLLGLGLSKLFHASGAEDLPPDSLFNSMGLFLQKTNIIRDYSEDTNEISKSHALKYEETSMSAVQCLNDVVTNALTHIEDCLTCMFALTDPAICRCYAIPMAHDLFFETNSVHISDQETMADVYGAFYDFSCILKSKKACRDSGLLNKRKSYILACELRYSSVLVIILLIILAIISLNPLQAVTNVSSISIIRLTYD
ncbi:hypothetical protein ACJRO7_027782 [Eucalyptus globulus]|uniref:Squalene synthase n=1 Tax=Eucalyptus globulus TaxID=34317 RepID=A0ABD3JZD8_EUCGL